VVDGAPGLVGLATDHPDRGNAVTATPVDVDNFVRAETDLMFAGLAASAGGTNRWTHRRQPAAIDDQVVVRLNRDTLYSFAVVDLAEGATVTLPDAAGRYLSVMVVNRDHHVTSILHDPGSYPLSVEEAGTRWVALAARVLADPGDPADLGAAHRVQDGLQLQAGSTAPFEPPSYDPVSHDAVRSALKDLARFSVHFERSFGAADEVDPVRHLIGTAVGWGGLPEREAIYLGVEPRRPVGTYRLTVGAVPVDGFWSISVYDADGYFEPNDRDAYSINSLTADRNPDGTVTIHFGGCDDDRPNCLPILEGWNYLVRLYRPREELRAGRWRFPELEEVG
jgi:hypothetical protein